MSYYEAPVLVCTASALRWGIHDTNFDRDAAEVRDLFLKANISVRTGASYWESIEPFCLGTTKMHHGDPSGMWKLAWFMDRDLFRCKSFENVAAIRRPMLLNMIHQHELLRGPLLQAWNQSWKRRSRSFNKLQEGGRARWMYRPCRIGWLVWLSALRLPVALVPRADQCLSRLVRRLPQELLLLAASPWPRHLLGLREVVVQAPQVRRRH